MRLRFLKQYTDRFGGIHREGDVHELRDDIAAKLIRNGIAIKAPEPPKIQTAERPRPAARTTARRTSKATPRK